MCDFFHFFLFWFGIWHKNCFLFSNFHYSNFVCVKHWFKCIPRNLKKKYFYHIILSVPFFFSSSIINAWFFRYFRSSSAASLTTMLFIKPKCDSLQQIKNKKLGLSRFLVQSNCGNAVRLAAQLRLIILIHLFSYGFILISLI